MVEVETTGGENTGLRQSCEVRAVRNGNARAQSPYKPLTAECSHGTPELLRHVCSVLASAAKLGDVVPTCHIYCQ